MPENIRKTLNRVGLKDPEIKVYLTCLENKQGLFVAEITKETGIKRSTVNLILDRLSEKGFVTYHLDGSRKLFSAESPETLLFHLEESLTDLRGLIPLLRITSGADKQTKIRFFEGKDSIEKIYHDILLTMKINRDPQKEILEISSGEGTFEIMPEHRKQFINKRIKERIPIRWLAPDEPISRKLDETSAKEFRKIKFFDSKKYKFNVEIGIYANKVSLVSLSKEHGGVIIENKSLAESFRSLFNLLWDSLK